MQVEALAESIRVYGFNAPVIIDDTDTLIAGHGRVLAAERLGMETVPCVLASHMTPEQIRAYRIVDNKSVSTEWDAEMLMKELDAITRELKIAPKDLGFSDDEINALMKEIGGARPIEDEFEEDEDQESPDQRTIQTGDIWQLGPHRLMCGDATDSADMSKLMDGELADIIVTDPPYNVDYGRKVDRMNEILLNSAKNAHIANDNMTTEAFIRFLTDTFKVVAENTRPGGAIYCFHSDVRGENFMKAIRTNGFKVAQILVWVKNRFVLSMKDYNWQHELVIYGWKEGATHYFANWFDESTVIDDAKPQDFRKMSKADLQRAAEEMYFKLNKIPTTVVRHEKPTDNADHPTMKPVSICGRFILNSSRPKDIVLDPFGGSGSTLIASDQLGRSARIMELETKHCATIIRRWEKATRLTAELIE